MSLQNSHLTPFRTPTSNVTVMSVDVTKTNIADERGGRFFTFEILQSHKPTKSSNIVVTNNVTDCILSVSYL